MSANAKRARGDNEPPLIVEEQLVADVLRSMSVTYDERVVLQLVEVMHG
jgi:methyl coenzyme M reductase alpha subunit